jgi:hypothetical protein
MGAQCTDRKLKVAGIGGEIRLREKGLRDEGIGGAGVGEVWGRSGRARDRALQKQDESAPETVSGRRYQHLGSLLPVRPNSPVTLIPVTPGRQPQFHHTRTYPPLPHSTTCGTPSPGFGTGHGAAAARTDRAPSKASRLGTTSCCPC